MDFVDLAPERKFDKIHKAIFKAMIQPQAEETSRRIRKNIMEVMESLKTFKKNAKVTFV
jgi:hypothetical protein